MKALVIFIMAFFIGYTAIAEESGPRKFEHFSDKELRELQKEVDSCYDHWRSDPIRYAKYFMSFHYPELSAGSMKNLPGKITYKEDDKTVVEIMYKGSNHVVRLYKLFPSNPKSIWKIEVMIIE